MSVEDGIEKTIGRFGRYQSMLLFLISIGRMPTEFQLTNVVFVLPSVDYVCLDEGANNMTNHCPCENPQYDKSAIENSVTSEWNLICGRTALASLSQSMLQVGILFGSLIFGYVSDRCGRKIVVLLCLFLTPTFVIISAVVPHLWMFMIARLLIGSTVGGTMLCCFVLLIEFSGQSFRPYLIGLHDITYVTSYFLLPVIAYFVRDWRYLQLVTSVPWLVVVTYYWIMPESPRWLITTGRKKEAIATLTMIAKRNGRPTDDIESIVNKIEKESLSIGQEHRGTYLDLFKTSKVRLYTMITAFVWLCCAHTHFGIGQYIGRLQGNIYFNVMISGASLIPALFLIVLAALYIRRKLSVIICFTTVAVSLIVFIFVPETMPGATLAFALIGNTGAYAAFVLIYLYSSEVFPTVIRNSAMGFASMFGRFGSFIAPFVVNIGVEWVSITIFSFLALFAAFLCLFLPETKGIVLLNSIEQTEEANDKKKTIK